MSAPDRHPPGHPGRPRGIVGRVLARTRKPAGTPPGTLVHTGARRTERVRLQAFSYGPGICEERALERIEDALAPRDGTRVTWINVDGLHEPSLLEPLADTLGIHRLVLEDVLNPHQRPKLESYGTHLFLVLRMLSVDADSGSVSSEQLSLIVGDGYVLSFQELPGDVFDPVRERLRGGRGRIRDRGADYLAYALVDAVVDAYFGVLEALGSEIDRLEDRTLTGEGPSPVQEVHALRREMLLVRRAVWPLRDALGGLLREDGGLVAEETRLFFRDVHDHAVQVIDTVEALREVLSGALDVHLSMLSHRMNEIMKVLTIIATIFIPLSFFTGWYGMNFDYMPELAVPWAYPALLSFMAILAGGMLYYFRRKRWL